MLSKYILLLTLVMSVLIYNLAQAATLQRSAIPNLNVTAAGGRWYAWGTSGESDSLIFCATMTLAKTSEKNFTMSSMFIMSPEAKLKSYVSRYECKIIDDSNIFVCDKGTAGDMTAKIIDIEYNSYMALYTAPNIENVRHGKHGTVFLFGRQKDMSGESLANFYFSKPHTMDMMGSKDLSMIRNDGC